MRMLSEGGNKRADKLLSIPKAIGEDTCVRIEVPVAAPPSSLPKYRRQPEHRSAVGRVVDLPKHHRMGRDRPHIAKNSLHRVVVMHDPRPR